MKSNFISRSNFNNLVIDKLPFITGLFIGLYFITFTVIGKDFAFMPGDFGDGRLNLYFLEHSYLFFTGQIKDFWNAPFMYPEKEVLSYSENLLGSAPFYAIFRILQFDRETSMQCWFILISILNYTCTYFFLKWVFKNRYAAVAGALVFAFSMALQSQMTHAQIFTRFPIPLALWAVLLFAEKFNPKYFFIALLLVIYQLYCGIYLGFMLLIPVAIALLLIIIMRRKEFLEKIKTANFRNKIFFAVVGNVILLLPIIFPYLRRAAKSGINNYSDIFHTIPTPLSFLFRQVGSLLWDKLPFMNVGTTAFGDHQIFPGGITFLSLILFLVITVISYIRSGNETKSKLTLNHQVIFLTTVLTFILFTRIGSFSGYKLVFMLPGFAAMRSLTRIINVELIFFAFSTAFIVSYIIQEKAKYSPLIFILFISLFVVDNYFYPASVYHSEKEVTQRRVSAIALKLSAFKKGSVISYEKIDENDNEVFLQIDAMLAVQQTGMKCLNAYTSTSPESYTPYWNHPDEKSRSIWLADQGYTYSEVIVIK